MRVGSYQADMAYERARDAAYEDYHFGNDAVLCDGCGDLFDSVDVECLDEIHTYCEACQKDVDEDLSRDEIFPAPPK